MVNSEWFPRQKYWWTTTLGCLFHSDSLRKFPVFQCERKHHLCVAISVLWQVAPTVHGSPGTSRPVTSFQEHILDKVGEHFAPILTYLKKTCMCLCEDVQCLMIVMWPASFFSQTCRAERSGWASRTVSWEVVTTCGKKTYGCFQKWWLPPNRPILIGFSIRNHPFWGEKYLPYRCFQK